MDQQQLCGIVNNNSSQGSSTYEDHQSHHPSPSDTGRHEDSDGGVSGQELAPRRASISIPQPVSDAERINTSISELHSRDILYLTCIACVVKDRLCDRAQPICSECLSTHQQCTYGTRYPLPPSCVPCTLEKDICDGQQPTCRRCLVSNRKCRKKSADGPRDCHLKPLKQRGNPRGYVQGPSPESLEVDDGYGPQERFSNVDVSSRSAACSELPSSNSVRGSTTERSPASKRRRSPQKETTPRKASKTTEGEQTEQTIAEDEDEAPPRGLSLGRETEQNSLGRTIPQDALAAENDRMCKVRDGVLARQKVFTHEATKKGKDHELEDLTNDHAKLQDEIAVLKEKLEQAELEWGIATEACQREKSETERMRTIQKEQEQELDRLRTAEKEHESFKEWHGGFMEKVHATDGRIREINQELRNDLSHLPKTERQSDE